MPADVRGLFTRLVTAMVELDYDALRELIHDDYVGDFRQSGERTRGLDGFRAQLEAYPGGAPNDPTSISKTRFVGDEERWAITPSYTVVPLASQTTYTALSYARYPDGSGWYVIGLIELRDDRVYRSEIYFAPELPVPLAQSIAAYRRG